MGLFDMFSTNGKSHNGPAFIFNGRVLTPREYGFSCISSSIDPMRGFMSALFKVEQAQNSGGILKAIINEPLPAELNSISMITAFFLVYPTLQQNIQPIVLDEVRNGMADGAKKIYHKLGETAATEVSNYTKDTIMFFAREVYKDLSNANIRNPENIKFNICNTTSAFSKISFHAYKSEADPPDHPRRLIDDMSLQQLSAALFSDTLEWIQNSNKIEYQDIKN